MENYTNKFEEKLPKYRHLKNIHDQLWSEDGKSRVSLMIGSGFSLNANKIDESLDGMSTWSELKTKILDGLGTDNDSTSEDVLELSQRYVDEYGKNSLEQLIKKGVPDQNYEPGELHKELLRLPWADIYTTNYDTLLEKTLPNIYERNYKVIYDPRDIPNSVNPRIVKLHGSLPSNRPFVFTKNDYEDYKDKFGPLVNMVQQSIMETTFLLVGFSGDDPNFKEWTKWVHKNLGEHMPNIYMMTFDESEKEDMLNQRGITLIDFKEVYKKEHLDDPYYKMFEDIFEYLGTKEEKGQKDWPFESYSHTFSEENIEKAVQSFINNREAYPGWITLPDIIKRSNINDVQMGSRRLEEIINRNGGDIKEKTSALYEILWVYDTFQIPMTVSLHKLMKKTVDESLEYIDCLNISNDLAYIIIRLIKEARLDFNEEEFNQYIELLESHSLIGDVINQLKYEKILFKLIKFEFSQAKELVDEWSVINNDIESSVKKAIVFSRLDEKEESKQLLEDSLNTVRKILSKEEKNNHRLLSLEGIILSNLIKLDRNSFKNSKGRLSTLELELCNPFKELNLMYSRIKPYERKTGNFKEKGFDPNRVTQTTKFKNTLELELVDSYGLIVLNEEWGLKSLHSSSVKHANNNALTNFEKLYPFYSWITYLQIGNKKSIGNFFSRDIVYRTNRGSISEIYIIAKNAIENRKNTYLMMEILSRLYFSLLKEQKKIADQLVIDLYNDKSFLLQKKNDIKKIFGNAFYRVLFDKNGIEKKEFIEKVYNIPILGDPQEDLSEVQLDYHFFYDPSFELTRDDTLIIEVDSEKISKLISLLDSGKGTLRDAALFRLIYLLDTGNMAKDIEQTTRSKIAELIRAEGQISDLLLNSYLVQLTNDSELQKKCHDSAIQAPIPKSYNKKTKTTAIGEALKNYLAELKNIFPGLIHKQSYFSSITDETYRDWLKVFYGWWESQEEWLLESKKKSSFGGETNDLLLMTIFLKNFFLPNIPLSCLNESDRSRFTDIYFKLKKHRKEIALLFIPTLIKLGIVEENEVYLIEEGMLNNDSEIYNSALNAIYDLVVMKKKGDIRIDLSEKKNLLLSLYRTRKELTISETSKVLNNIIYDAPEFFSEQEYSIIIQTLNLIYNDLMNGYYYNSSISDQELKLMAESTKLAGEIYRIYEQPEISELEVWKELSESNRLPEVRMYYYLFE